VFLIQLLEGRLKSQLIIKIVVLATTALIIALTTTVLISAIPSVSGIADDRSNKSIIPTND